MLIILALLILEDMLAILGLLILEDMPMLAMITTMAMCTILVATLMILTEK